VKLILDFTGVSAPYETPGNPDLSIDTSVISVARAVEMIVSKLGEHVSVFFWLSFRNHFYVDTNF